MADQQPMIVVINDDPVQLHLIAKVLEAAGHRVRPYVDSADALDSLAEDPEVGLFVVDLHMPGIDGWKVCRLLRGPDFRGFNETPILVVSATFMGADVEAITADIGADGFVPMPFERDNLLGHVRDLLSGHRPHRRAHALLVEDNDGVARAVGRTFDANGYNVHRACTLDEAEALWIELQPELVLLDYHLPDGSALELLEKLQSPAGRTVVLIMTGDTDPDLPVRLLKHGADAYVRKPFDPTFLLQLAGKARRERSLLRVESLLEARTQELRRSEARYRTLFEAIPDLVLTVDALNEIVGANHVALETLGDGTDDLEQRHISAFLDEDAVEDVEVELDRIRAHGTGCFETELYRPDGRKWIVEITGSAPKDADVGSVLLVARDLTERRRAEEERRRLDAQVQHAQRLESLGVLAGGIAHDFNNLLVGVMGNASLALMDAEEGSSIHQCVTQIETAARRAAELTQQILTFSGKGEAAMSPQDLSSVVSEMGQLLAPAVSKKAKLVYRLRSDLPAVNADASQLRQVVMNLIMNASDAIGDEPGRIQVGTALETLDADTKHEHHIGVPPEPGRYVVLEVRDDGCGMDADTQRQIFDPFFTTKFAGRGLGLAATLGIVRAHAGAVMVRSEAGEGTTFRVFLPALGHAVDPRLDKPTEDGASVEGDGRSILVVDDEPSVRMLAGNALRRAGFGVREAANGRRALRMIHAEPDTTVVLLDVTMPSMTGTEVLTRLRDSRPDLPVILSSGYPPETLPPGTLDHPATAFLRKPYSPRDLLGALERVLDPPPVAVVGGGGGLRGTTSTRG